MPKKISKRKKFIIVAFILSLGLGVLKIANIFGYFQSALLLSIFAYFLFAWALKEGLKGIEWLSVLVLPAVFTAGISFFYFFLPFQLTVIIPVGIFYGLGIYIFLLVGNIFSVATFRTIQLLRSAQAVGFLLILVTSFFLYDAIFSFRFPFWTNFLLVGLVSFPLIFSGLWCINLEEKITFKLLIHTLAFSLIQGEMALLFSFWPVKISVGSLALTTVLYVIIGLGQHYFAQRLFPKTIKEYLRVGIIIFLVIFLTTRWGE